MISLGTVQEDSTIYLPMSTSGAGGVEENFSGTLEEADFIIRKNGSTMTLDANTINAGAALGAFSTGLYEVPINLSIDADFTRGASYLVYAAPDSETLNSLAVSGVLGHFRIESDDEQAVRFLRQFLYPSNSVVTVTSGNTAGQINLTGIVNANTTKMAGELLLVHKNSNDVMLVVRITSFTYPNAIVEDLEGNQMPFVVAINDHVWRVGQFTAKNSSVQNIASETQVTGIADNTIAILSDTATLKTDTASIITKADTLLTRVAQTIAFSTAGNVKADIQEINEVTIIGDGSTTPFNV